MLLGYPIKKWENYTAILSDNYIYFYKNAKDVQYETYFYIRDAKVEVCNPEIT